MRISRVLVAVVVAALVYGAGAAGQDRKHQTGQTVTPSFDGWFPNADGGFSLVFGYYNRNFDEEVDVPIGPNNRIEPGPADQGQPTHFLPRRQFGAFAVTVPKDFGKRTVTWTLVDRGGTFAIPGYLRPEWQINAFDEITTGDKPPTLKLAADGKIGEGPAGLSTSIKATAGQATPLTVWAAPRVKSPADEGPRERMPIAWSQFRGPAMVAFSEPRPKVDKTGLAATTATFPQPGDYTLRVLAGTADTTGCCWTNGYVKVTVAGTQK